VARQCAPDAKAKNGSSRLPLAIILGSSVNGLSVLRSLARRGVPVLCADTYAGIASKSRFGTFVQLDRSEGEARAGEKAADVLFARFAEAGLEPVALGTADEWQVYLADRASRGDAPFRAIVPGREVMNRIDDKQAQYEFAVEHGIPVPPFANGRDVLQGDVEWKIFPAIIKPRWTHLGRTLIGGKAVVINSPEDLRARLEWLESISRAESFIVQEIIEGGDGSLHAYLGCFDSSGNEVAHVVKRKLRQHPPDFGDGSIDETCECEEVRILGMKLLAAMDYRGLAGIEFKKSSRDGTFSLIEINPRSVSTNQLTIASGVDFPWLAYQLARGEPVNASAPYRRNLRHVNEERELRAFYIRWKRKEQSLLAWLRSIVTADSYSLWDRGDPRPFVSAMSGVFFGDLKRRLFGMRRQAAAVAGQRGNSRRPCDAEAHSTARASKKVA